jgi:uncharacterized protein YacL
MFVESVRLFLVVLGTAAGYYAAADLGLPNGEALGGTLGCLLGYVAGGLVGRGLEKAVGVVERRVEHRHPIEVVAGTVGAVGGAVAGAALSVPIVLVLPAKLALPIGGLLVWIGVWAGFRVLGSRAISMLEMFGLSTRPLVRAQAFDARDGFLVDTSVVMDGQLLRLVRAGILASDFLVPRFILDELQGFADSPDSVRRRRARQGLEMLEALRKDTSIRLYVLDDELPEIDEVDAKLVALAKRLELRLLTNDSALAHIAELQGVPTCNLRRLALDLAPSVLAGDFVRVALTKYGRERGQGVGHLDDGTMVIVNHGASLVGGPEVQLQVTSVVPTSAGRLLFAQLEVEGPAILDA